MLVTGAAHGTGRIIASAVALHDVQLILVDCDGPQLEKAARELKADGMFCDPQAASSVDIFEAQFKKEYDHLHMLVNAADIGHGRVLSTIRMTAALLPLLRRTPGSKAIVNVAPDRTFGTDTPFKHSSSPEATARYSDYLRSTIKDTAIHVATLFPEGEHSNRGHCEVIEPLASLIVRDFIPRPTVLHDEPFLRRWAMTASRARLFGRRPQLGSG